MLHLEHATNRPFKCVILQIFGSLKIEHPHVILNKKTKSQKNRAIEAKNLSKTRFFPKNGQFFQKNHVPL